MFFSWVFALLTSSLSDNGAKYEFYLVEWDFNQKVVSMTLLQLHERSVFTILHRIHM